MTTLYVGEKHAYRDEVSIAREESPRAAIQAVRMNTLEWDPRLLYQIRWNGGENMTTDVVEVYGLVKDHPDCDVRIIPVH
jgi:hypothetical protein